jgi:anti-anti-sigma factor
MGTGKFAILKFGQRRFDGSSAVILRPRVGEIWQSGATVLALDLSDVVYIDRLGISALISEQRRRPKGSRIVICSVGDYVRDVLEVTQLVGVFDIYADAAAVEAAFSR